MHALNGCEIGHRDAEATQGSPRLRQTRIKTPPQYLSFFTAEALPVELETEGVFGRSPICLLTWQHTSFRTRYGVTQVT